MVNPIVGNAAIFRCTTAGDTEANVTAGNLIQFDGSSLNPDDKSHISQWQTRMTAAVNENPRPQSNNPHDLQDNGLAQTELKITMFFDDPSNAIGPTWLRNWMREAKMSTGTNPPFPFGRFGVRHNDFPIFNHTPTSTSGWVLIQVEWFRPTDQRYKAGAIVTLKFNGDITKLGV